MATYSDVVEALSIFEKYVSCDHIGGANTDIIWGLILDDVKLTQEELDRLIGLLFLLLVGCGPSFQVAPPVYHGGLVMTGTTHVYLIWYGNWNNNTATSIIPDLITGLNGSSYYGILTSYYQNDNQHISNSIELTQIAFDNYSQGKTLPYINGAANIVQHAINNGMPADANGVYIVLGSSDVQEGQSGKAYCGYHSFYSNIKFVFIPDPSNYPNACIYQNNHSPNDNVAADAMSSFIAHELVETVSDPLFNAWNYDGLTSEIGDTCVNIYGDTYTTSNGSSANVHLDNRDFLLQEVWNNKTQSCELRL